MGLFNHSSSHQTCTTHSFAENAPDAVVGTMSFYTLNKIISGACAAATVLIMFVFTVMHATHYSKPNEQAKSMRIGLLLPAYAIGSFLSVAFPAAHVYIDPWLVFIESISLGTFFLLLCDFITPHSGEREAFFASREFKGRKGKPVDNSVAWFRTRWTFVFQFPVVSLLVAILTDITQAAGVYCQFESKTHYAKLWLSIAQNISITMAIMTCINFYIQLKQEFSPFRVMAKFVGFKAVVGLTFIQGILFWILIDSHALKPNNTLTWADVNIGIPSLLINVEMVPLSLIFCWAYPWTPYMRGHKNYGTIVKSYAQMEEGSSGSPVRYQGGFLGIKAYIDMLNPLEVFRAILYGVQSYGERKNIQTQEEHQYLTSRRR